MKYFSRKCYLSGASGALLLSVLVLCGCNSRLSLEEMRQKNAENDRKAQGDTSSPFSSPLTFKEIVGYALEHNLDARVMSRQIAYQEEMTKRTYYNMLPKLEAKIDYSNRSEYNASKSIGLDSGKLSKEISYSSDKENAKASINALWNVMDFGISFFMAKQAESKSLIARQELRKVKQDLVLETARAYWQYVIASQGGAVDELGYKLKARIVNVKKQVMEKTISAEQGLAEEKRILSVLMRLQDITRQKRSAKAELARLMGLNPGTKFELEQPKIESLPVFSSLAVKRLETEALYNHPEFFKYDLQESITNDNVRISIIKMFPSPAVFLNAERDNNPYLYYSNWYTVGARASWDLLSLPGRVSEIRAGRYKVDLIREQRVALAMALFTQIHLSVLQLDEASERFSASAEIMKLQENLFEITKKSLKEGKADERKLLDVQAELVFAKQAWMRAYADQFVAFERINNAVGKDPAYKPYSMLVRKKAGSHMRFDTGRKVVWRKKNKPEQSPEGIKLAKEAMSGKMDIADVSSGSLSAEARGLYSNKYSVFTKSRDALIAAGKSGAEAVLPVAQKGDSKYRIRAILVIKRVGDKDIAAKILPLLADESPSVRYQASLALREVFGKNFGYYYDARKSEREKAIKAWANYLALPDGQKIASR